MAAWLGPKRDGGNGEERSFFILSPEKPVDAVIDELDKFIGKACTVKWKSSHVEIPEAGGTMHIDQILPVSWD
ncbi:MAG: hypothetical protein Fur0032_19620 [Terrimicrobiaceae bacterium]